MKAMKNRITNCLALDMGSSSGRAYIAQYKNGVLKLREMDRFSTMGKTVDGGLYWDFYNLLDRTKANLKRCATELNDPLYSVGVECCGDDYGLLDADSQLLGLPHNYRDPRTHGTEKIVAEKMGNALYERTGVHFMRHNTLNQLVAERADAHHLLDRAESMLFLGDLFHYHLTGRRNVEYSGASITQMMNCFTKEWDPDIFAAFNIPQRICEKIIHAGAIYGSMSDKVLQETGLTAGTLAITPPTHDSAAAVVPIPKIDDGDLAYISSGTWSIIGLEIDHPIVNESSLRFNISNSGTAFGKLMFTKNIMGLWIIQQCRRIWEIQRPGLSFSDIVSLAEKAQPFAAMIDPDDATFFDAANTPAAISAYLIETDQAPIAADDIGGIARLIFESLAMKYRYIFERMCLASGKNPKDIYIIGGGGNNQILNQFTANATGMPVRVSLPEATAVGNAMMQLYGLGQIASHQEIRQTVHQSFPITSYLPMDTQIWEKHYGEFVELLRQRSDCSFS